MILDELMKNNKNNLISFHVPGHKNGKIYDLLGYKNLLESIYKMDTTEIIGTDNLHSPEGIIKKSQEKASRVFKSDKTYFLVNGTTCGIQASIMSVCNDNDKILVNRDCHHSVINSCILGNVNPVYIDYKLDNDYFILEGVLEEDVIKSIDENLDAKGLVLTYPTYYGATYDLEKICEYAHKKNMVVIVDEAHGAHLGLSEKLPKTALEQGADIVIQSTHKTLPSFTQSSMLHIKGSRVDSSKISEILRIIETSSPSYLLMSSLEIATEIYEKYGRYLTDKLLENIDDFIKDISKNDFVEVYNKFDKTKIFISLKKLGITGYELEKILRKNNIQVELSNYYGVLLICTISNYYDDFESIKNAINNIITDKKDKYFEELKTINYPKIIPKKILNPREAFYKNKKSVKIYDSIGQISGEYIIPYPPGVSILSPGEIITKEIIDYILYLKEMNISGISDTSLENIKIIER